MPMQPLSTFDGRRDNNYTLIRLIMAWLVLYGHSYAIQPGGYRDPLNYLFQGSTYIGDLAVNAFFAISGFLIVRSFMKRGLKNYLFSRVLRIYPAIIVCVFLMVFIMGPLVTELAIAEYIQHAQTLGYLKNMLVVLKMKFFLPGVFESHTKTAVNGSLWTLTVEVRCYLSVALLGVLGVFRYRLVANIILLGLLLWGFLAFSDIPFLGGNFNWARLEVYFLTGSLVYLNRDLIPLSKWLVIPCLLVMGFSFGKPWYDYAVVVPLCYLIFWLVYCTPHIDLDSKVGDLSYGVYIYAWPIQQITVILFPDLMPWSHSLFASVLVLLFAYASWRLVEKPALAIKRYL